MKQTVWITLFVLFLTAVTSVGQETATPVAASRPAATQPAAAESPLDQLRSQAMAQLLSGQFGAGADTLGRILELDPSDESSLRAAEWVRQYVERQTAKRRERKSEYEMAVMKAKRLLKIARGVEQADEQAEEGLAQIRKKVKDVRELTSELLGAPSNEENYTQADWFGTRLSTDADKIRSEFAEIRTYLDQNPVGWSDELLQAGELVLLKLRDFEAAAAKESWDSFQVGQASLEAVEESSEPLQEALDDLSAMTSTTPWQAALGQVRMAKYVLAGETTFLQEPWAAAIVTGARTQAEAFTTEAKWYKALGLYSGLAELHKQQGTYKDEVRRISRHARVLAVYAPDEEDEDEDEEDESPPDTEGGEESPTQPVVKREEWRESLRGVDAFSVRKAISRIEENYVENVDYRKVLRGALTAVRVLAESPQLVEPFPGLGDEQAKARFLQRLAELIDQARTMDLPTHSTAGAMLTSVLRANRQTVKIPAEVIAIEFTDGMTEQLDRFTQMIWPNEWSHFQKHTMGRFFGVGIHIEMEHGLLKVVSPLEDTPAYRAGIHAGDFIIKINGKSAKKIDINEAVRQITGPKGTKVILTLKRAGREPFDKTLVRDEIQIQTVKGWKRDEEDKWDWMIDPDNRIGYVRLKNFSKYTTNDLRLALAHLRADRARGMILDLRDNPGGLLTTAIDVADEFLATGNGAIITTKGRQQQTRIEGRVSKNGGFLGGALVVLIDNYSASASEIVSGVLKDFHRAVVVGRRSFGKGVVQKLIPIFQDRSHLNDAFLKVTTAHYYLPSGRCLHRVEGASEWGVEPDVRVTVTPKQLRKWIRIRRKTEIIRSRNPGDLDKEMTRQFHADSQLDAALLVCRLLSLQEDLRLAKADKPER